MPGAFDLEALSREDVRPQHQALTDIGPSLDHVEKAYDAAKRGRLPEGPPLSIVCQTAGDSAMAPPGVRTLSIIAKYDPHVLAKGNWVELKDQAVDNAFRVLESYAPGTRHRILNLDVLTPLDLERLIGFAERDVTHLDQTLNSTLSFRPRLGWAHARTSVDRL